MDGGIINDLPRSLSRPCSGHPNASPRGSGQSKATRDEVINQGGQMDCAKFFERKLKDAVLLKIDISMR